MSVASDNYVLLSSIMGADCFGVSLTFGVSSMLILPISYRYIRGVVDSIMN